MGGDTPCDVVHYVESLLEISSEMALWMHMPDHWTSKEKDLVKTAMDGYGLKRLIQDALVEINDNITMQVIGLCAISCGAVISDEDRQAIMTACENNDWALEDEERRRHCQKLKAAVGAYTGVSVQLQQSTLSDCLDEMEQKGMVGLMNIR